MNPLLVAELIVKVGLPLTEKLIELYHAGKTVDPAVFEELKALAAYRSSDALLAAGGKNPT